MKRRMSSIQAASIAVNLMGKAVVLAAKWAATRRRSGLAAAAARPEDDKAREIVFLRDRVAELQSRVEILRQLHKPDNTTRYTIGERLMVIFARDVLRRATAEG